MNKPSTGIKMWSGMPALTMDTLSGNRRTVDFESFDTNERELTLGSYKELEQFLAGVEKRAFRMAEIATGNAEDAMDILQDSMFKLVQKYADRNPLEWGALFQTILQSRITYHYRRNAVRNRFRVWFGRNEDEEDVPDPIQMMEDVSGSRPDREVAMAASMQQLEKAVRELPARQRQAFMLRALEGMDVSETAKVMKCSEGSVKTHYFRALAVLRDKLEDYRL